MDYLHLLSNNIHLLLISCFGGLVLFGMKVAEHFSRSEQDKLELVRYVGFVIFLLLVLPVLGVGVTSIYIVNGDKLSPILAFQVGLTSPAIVQSLIIVAADRLAKNSPTETAAGQ